MDWVRIRGKMMDFLKKYRYVVLVVGIGLVLMAIPERQQTDLPAEPAEETVPEQSISAKLEQILSSVEGAGQVRVLLTEAKGAETVYQSDVDSDSGENSGSMRQDTVIISDSSRLEQGLIRQVNPPTYLGAIILCQGADKASVRLAIVEAVSSVTGLGADRISVLKMK